VLNVDMRYGPGELTTRILVRSTIGAEFHQIFIAMLARGPRRRFRYRHSGEPEIWLNGRSGGKPALGGAFAPL
jgi:hypothetical protein